MTQPTIGSNVENVTHNNIHFEVWDLGGQQTLRNAWWGCVHVEIQFDPWLEKKAPGRFQPTCEVMIPWFHSLLSTNGVNLCRSSEAELLPQHGGGDHDGG
jgi:GTPase SAR1 family protein